MSVINQLLTEKVRPKNLDQIILLDRIRKSVDYETLSQNFLFHSQVPGSGKTSLSKILSSDKPTLYLNVSSEGRIDVLREEITEFCSTRALNNYDSDYKVVILDEMDGGSNEFFKALRAVMEKFSDHVRFIGTCNYINKIPEPIQLDFW